MKKTLRFTSAALTLALAAGMALPAFAAAKPSFSKDETVYAVMAPDGSVTSTTVSAATKGSPKSPDTEGSMAPPCVPSPSMRPCPPPITSMATKEKIPPRTTATRIFIQSLIHGFGAEIFPNNLLLRNTE